MRSETSLHMNKVDLTQPRDGCLIRMKRYSEYGNIGLDLSQSILLACRH